jgi:hypothetical protein
LGQDNSVSLEFLIALEFAFASPDFTNWSARRNWSSFPPWGRESKRSHLGQDKSVFLEILLLLWNLH